MKKLTSLLLAVLLLAMAIPSMAEEPVHLRIATWTSNEDQLKLLSSFVDEFAQAKGIAIEPEFISLSGTEYSSLLLMNLQSNEPADAFWVMEADIKAYMSAGLCAKLNDAMAAYDPDDLDDGAMSLWCDGDDVYAIPFSTSPFIMIYNADLFAEAGLKDPNEYVAEGTWTWETFRECMKAIKDKTGVYGYMTVNNAGYSDRTEMNLTPFVRGFGGDFWTDDLEVLIDSPESIAAVQMFHDMVYVDGSVVPPGDESNFFTGGAACTFNRACVKPDQYAGDGVLGRWFWFGEQPFLKLNLKGERFCNESGPYDYMLHSTVMQPQGSRVGINIVPFNIHIMKPMPKEAPKDV